MMPEAQATPLRIGLLFVHGIGEQKRFEFLTSTVREFAELMKVGDPDALVSVVDRTGDWPHGPGLPDPASAAPITLSYQATDGGGKDRTIHFECHEVWWADLGARSGLFETFNFWLWGLGQWNAPIYQEINFARVNQNILTNRRFTELATPPESKAKSFLGEISSRFKLLLAGIAALFTLVTWTLAKRILAAISGTLPTPSIIVEYLGDVRTFERRATPGSSTVSDPGFPLRVGIRRRMVTEMVAMADRELDGWYVVAHSLGTLLAYNGLTEIGHTLPNYLSERQWRSVSGKYKRDPQCMRRINLAAMMPARPTWLRPDDLINRPLLFQRLRGVLTFGSPLGKFAALWPRIVATATDRADNKNPFPGGCRWINLAAPHDPVAGRLDSYAADQPIAEMLPKLESYSTPLWFDFILSHIGYFRGAERFVRNRSVKQKLAVMDWLLDKAAPYPLTENFRGWRPFTDLLIFFVYLSLVMLLGGLAAAAVLAVGDISISLLDGKEPQNQADFYNKYVALVGPVFGFALSLVVVSGLIRWSRESLLNLKLAIDDQKRGFLNNGRHVITLLSVQFGTGALASVGGMLLILAAVLDDLGAYCPFLAHFRLPWSIIASSSFLIAALVGAVAMTIQSAVNSICRKISKQV